MLRNQWLLLFVFCSAAAAAGGVPKKALALETAPCYEEPRSDGLPRLYVGPSDTILVDSVFIDSSNVAWFKVRAKNLSVWTIGAKVRYVSEVSGEMFAVKAQEDQDKFRRLKILREHDAWPRRIKNAVRAGQVCLSMTGQQLEASWEAPQQKEKLFILGIGACESWHYAATAKKPCSVILQNDAVIGWSAER
jgi:hypothetical protein